MEKEVCSVCNGLIFDTEKIVHCSNCGAAYHKKCWEDNDGCIKERCGGTKFEETLSTLNSDTSKGGMFSNIGSSLMSASKILFWLLIIIPVFLALAFLNLSGEGMLAFLFIFIPLSAFLSYLSCGVIYAIGEILCILKKSKK